MTYSLRVSLPLKGTSSLLCMRRLFAQFRVDSLCRSRVLVKTLHRHLLHGACRGCTARISDAGYFLGNFVTRDAVLVDILVPTCLGAVGRGI